MATQPEIYRDMPTYDNDTRPDPKTVPEGTPIFNTDDNAPQWSDGEYWRDAKGDIT